MEIKKVSMSKDNRIKLRQNYEALDSIKREITKRVEQEYSVELKALEEENKYFRDEEVRLKKDAKDFLLSVNAKTKLKVCVQVGEGGRIINEYVGTLQRDFTRYDTYFNFIDPTYLDGKPFTIGFSCLLSIEKL